MPKRFIDTGFLSQKWIRKLSPERKAFLIYLMLECDNAGIIDLDMDDAEFWVGKKIGDPLSFLPNGYLIPLKNSGKFFQPKFIKWQYGDLTSNKNIVIQARQILENHKLIDSDFNIILPKSYLKVTKKLPKSKVTGIGKDKGIGKGKEGESEGEKNNYKFTEFIHDFNSITGKSFKGDNTAKTHFNARIKEGYTKNEILKAIQNCFKDPFHKQNPKYLTPEFITRPDKIEKFLNYKQSLDSRNDQSNFDNL